MLKLVLWPDEVLQKPTEKITDFLEVATIAEQMFDVMYKNNGIGLAAPQVGLSKCMFVMDISQNKKIIINPEILNHMGTHALEESCLSFPGIKVKVDRSGIVDVQYQNEKGEVLKERLFGLEAICFQHEFDHLQGKTFIEELPSSTKLYIKKTLERTKR